MAPPRLKVDERPSLVTYIAPICQFSTVSWPGGTGLYPALWANVNDLPSTSSPTPPAPGELQFPGSTGTDQTMRMEILRVDGTGSLRHQVDLTFTDTGDKIIPGGADVIRLDAAYLLNRPSAFNGTDIRGFDPFVASDIAFKFTGGLDIGILEGHQNMLNQAFFFTSSAETARLKSVSIGQHPGGANADIAVALWTADRKPNGNARPIDFFVFKTTGTTDTFEVDHEIPPDHDCWLALHDLGPTSRYTATLGVEFSHVGPGRRSSSPGKHFQSKTEAAA